MNKNHNIICIDFGTKYIGIAVGNNINKISHPIKTLKTKNKNLFWKLLSNIIKIWNPYLFIIGIPIHYNNNFLLKKKIKNFVKKLFFFYKIKVILHDESFSSCEARKLLKEHNIKNNKIFIHSISASIILEDWFNLN